MSKARVVPGGNSGGGYVRSQAYDDPQVARTITRLRQKLVNLEDKQPGSLIKNDVYKYLIKPAIGAAANMSGNDFNALRGPLKQVGSRQVGSSQFTWYMNAAASRYVDYLILENANSIFGNLDED